MLYKHITTEEVIDELVYNDLTEVEQADYILMQSTDEDIVEEAVEDVVTAVVLEEILDDVIEESVPEESISLDSDDTTFGGGDFGGSGAGDDF